PSTVGQSPRGSIGGVDRIGRPHAATASSATTSAGKLTLLRAFSSFPRSTNTRRPPGSEPGHRMAVTTEIRHLAEHVGEDVTLQGWIETTRSHGRVGFAVLRDGSGIVQAVFSQREIA